MGFVDAETMLGFKQKILKKIDELETPRYISQGGTVTLQTLYDKFGFETFLLSWVNNNNQHIDYLTQFKISSGQVAAIRTIRVSDLASWIANIPADLSLSASFSSLVSALYRYRDDILTQKDLTSSLVGYTTTALLTIPMESAPDNQYKGAKFTIGIGDYSGLYTFTYGNCMVLLPIKDLTTNTVYKIAACLVNTGGSYETRVLSYSLDGSGNLYIYDKSNYLAIGYTAYLFKIKIY